MLVFTAVVLVVLASLVISSVARKSPTGDPGRLTEAAVALPPGIPLPELSDATATWGLSDLAITPAEDMMAGGVAIADLDGDEAVDLVIANGDVAVLRWDPSADAYDEAVYVDLGEAIGVTAADVDRDGYLDLLVATATGSDAILWGGSWLVEGEQPQQTMLTAQGQSSGLLAGELSGDAFTDVVRLGRGSGDNGPQPDILWVSEGARSFRPQELPAADRYTLAGELVDVDNDGLLDIWLTRDIGWASGGDSVLSRQGDPTGEWVDVAPSLGLALEVDGMGITVADLDGDRQIDAYVSDLGDNEVMLGSAAGFTPVFETGAAHIRPRGAADDIVSSTWGTGAIDINLDGILDLVVASGGFPVGSVSNKIDGTAVAVAEPPAVLVGVGEGTFVDVWSQLGLNINLVARGLAVGDLDNDNDDDFVVIDRSGKVVAIRNDGAGPTLFFQPVPAEAGEARCDLAGAIVTVTTEVGSYQRVVTAHGYASSHSTTIIVGNPTGGSATAEVRRPASHDAPPGSFVIEAERDGASVTRDRRAFSVSGCGPK